MNKIAIVGLGPAGIFCLALLPPELLAQTIVFEPTAVGGALATEYGAVVANIPKSSIVAAFRNVPRWADAIFPHLEKYKDDTCPVLIDTVRQMRDLIAPDLARTNYHSARVLDYERKGQHWILTTSHGMYEAQKLLICTGATPKSMDLPKLTIPLHIALSPVALPNFVTPSDRIVVFGTAHSGTLVLKNLCNAGVRQLTGLYKGAKPFQYARDGFSEGIKQESAVIADDIVDKKWANLVSLDDFAAAYRAIAEATAVVYAVGFDRPVPSFLEDGVRRPFFAGAYADVEHGVWGFGIGFPAQYTGSDGKLYPDVGFGGFVNAIKAALPLVLTFAP